MFAAASQTSAQSRHRRMHWSMSTRSATQASAQLRHIFAQYMAWWTASPSGWLTCPRTSGCKAIILRMDMAAPREIPVENKRRLARFLLSAKENRRKVLILFLLELVDERDRIVVRRGGPGTWRASRLAVRQPHRGRGKTDRRNAAAPARRGGEGARFQPCRGPGTGGLESRT